MNYPNATRLHSLAARLAREAARAGYTSIQVSAAAAPGVEDLRPGVVTLVMPPERAKLSPIATDSRIRNDYAPEVLQVLGPDEEFTFGHVVEVIFEQGYNKLVVIDSNGVGDDAPTWKVAALMLMRSENCFVGTEG